MASRFTEWCMCKAFNAAVVKHQIAARDMHDKCVLERYAANALKARIRERLRKEHEYPKAKPRVRYKLTLTTKRRELQFTNKRKSSRIYYVYQ